jgi:hypothetical protein
MFKRLLMVAMLVIAPLTAATRRIRVTRTN